MPSSQLAHLLSQTCQLSSNTDEGVRLLIRSQPTLIGQYVFALRQKLAKESDLEAARFDLRRREIELRRKLVQKERLEKQIQTSEDPTLLQLDLELLLLDIEQAESGAALQSALERDCLREIALCDAELARIEAENGGPFGDLSVSEFQGAMAADTHGRYAAKMAAITLANYLRIPLDVATLLVEIPPETRPAIWRAYQRQLQSVHQFLEALDDHARSLHLGTERDNHLPSGANTQFPPV